MELGKIIGIQGVGCKSFSSVANFRCSNFTFSNGENHPGFSVDFVCEAHIRSLLVRGDPFLGRPNVCEHLHRDFTLNLFFVS